MTIPLKSAISKSLLIILTCLLGQHSFAQTFIPGNTYFDDNAYVEYIAGNLPIVISVPHGGYLEPDVIPDRDCTGCSYLRDSYTQEMGREIQEAIIEQTGCYPHMVINLLHRKKFDANRDIDDAADGNLTVEQSWYAYHQFLDSAKLDVVQKYGRGLFLDLHGHAHDIQRLELGYTLSKSELQLTDTELNQAIYVEESSIQTLVNDNLENLNHAELLRGEHSFGTLIHNYGFPAVPSMADPFPLDTQLYFTGGYNTLRHGSINGGEIDGIQIECNSDLRFDSDLRQEFADSVAQTILDYIDLHYNDDFIDNYCALLISNSELSFDRNFNIFPNPAGHQFQIETIKNDLQVTIYNTMGTQLTQFKWDGGAINIDHLDSGLYILKFQVAGVYYESKVLIKE